MEAPDWVEKVTTRIDDNRARRCGRRIGHDLTRWVGLPRHWSSRRRAGDQPAARDDGSKTRYATARPILTGGVINGAGRSYRRPPVERICAIRV